MRLYKVKWYARDTKANLYAGAFECRTDRLSRYDRTDLLTTAAQKAGDAIVGNDVLESITVNLVPIP